MGVNVGVEQRWLKFTWGWGEWGYGGKCWGGIGAAEIYLLGWGYGEISVDNGVEEAEHKYIF